MQAPPLPWRYLCGGAASACRRRLQLLRAVARAALAEADRLKATAVARLAAAAAAGSLPGQRAAMSCRSWIVQQWHASVERPLHLPSGGQKVRAGRVAWRETGGLYWDRIVGGSNDELPVDVI